MSDALIPLGIFFALFTLVGLAGRAVDWLSRRATEDAMMVLGGAVLAIVMVGSLAVNLAAPRHHADDSECIGPPSESC